MSMISDKVVNIYKEHWSFGPDVISRAPGRVNLIGEHTDYTGGFVLPVAIDREIIFAARKMDGDTVTGYSIDFGEKATCRIGEYDPEAEYQKVRLTDGTSGFMHRDFLWSMVGHRAALVKSEAGEWQLCTFVSGD